MVVEIKASSKLESLLLLDLDVSRVIKESSKKLINNK